VSHAVIVPVAAVLAIYARENGQGMALPEDNVAAETEGDASAQGDQAPPDDDGDEPPPAPRRGPHLRIVK